MDIQLSKNLLIDPGSVQDRARLTVTVPEGAHLRGKDGRKLSGHLSRSLSNKVYVLKPSDGVPTRPTKPFYRHKWVFSVYEGQKHIRDVALIEAAPLDDPTNPEDDPTASLDGPSEWLFAFFDEQIVYVRLRGYDPEA